MSKATKRKHVTKEVLEDYYVPEDDEVIVKVSLYFQGRTFAGKISRIGPTAKFSYFAGINFRG